jgi:hypothetical protein
MNRPDIKNFIIVREVYLADFPDDGRALQEIEIAQYALSLEQLSEQKSNLISAGVRQQEKLEQQLKQSDGAFNAVADKCNQQALIIAKLQGKTNYCPNCEKMARVIEKCKEALEVDCRSHARADDCKDIFLCDKCYNYIALQAIESMDKEEK